MRRLGFESTTDDVLDPASADALWALSERLAG